jgi:hypothetical protein
VIPRVWDPVNERAGQVAREVKARGVPGAGDLLVEERCTGLAMARPEAEPAQLGGTAVGVADLRLIAEAPRLAGRYDAIALDGHDRLARANPGIDDELPGIALEPGAHVIGRNRRARDDAGGMGGQQCCELLDVRGLAIADANHQTSDQDGPRPRRGLRARRWLSSMRPTREGMGSRHIDRRASGTLDRVHGARSYRLPDRRAKVPLRSAPARRRARARRAAPGLGRRAHRPPGNHAKAGELTGLLHAGDTRTVA